MATVRSTGSATITFGLVSVPVKVYTAVSEERVSFKQIHKDCGSTINMPTICAKCDGKKVERSELLKGYEVAKGEFVLFTDDELKSLEVAAEVALDIGEFVPAGSIDPIRYASTNYLAPDKGADKPYGLLAAAMEKAGVVGIAQRVFRGKEQLVAIRAVGGVLHLHELYYATEVRNPAALEIVVPQLSAGEMKAAGNLIEALASDSFDPSKYSDGYQGRVLAAIEAKKSGEVLQVADKSPTKAAAVDLMAALTASLEAGQKLVEGKKVVKKAAGAASKKSARA